MGVDNFLSTIQTIGGIPAPEELAQLRLEICRGCPFSEFSKLTPVSDELFRCSICRCPLENKTRALTSRGKLSILKPLKRTVCPHEDGNKWNDTDINFLDITTVNKLNKL